ncbi:hypothetical protein DFH08DRAFT_710349 [Mycena albidolilacea]|uniref:Uncharacterized protein n=1 Tax=Mycena albidolilacea TaxID=1033008 RepID=A0AAD6ZKC3_9AGAR|nr:hypothetical protein DFH08DRAFT_710349 [Mycena albidolilacea]
MSSSVAADCLAAFNRLRAAGGEIEGGTDNHGHPVNIANATAMTYALCVHTCGTRSHFRPWGVFSQRFSTWLLPFLALVSQLPFGANNRLDNLMSILLNVGSPTLGAYSLLLSLLNSRWVAHRFSDISYPNAASAARILSNLQQVPLKVTTADGLLASLIVLPENNEWWSDLLVWLDINYMYTWSFANVASIGWVVVAFSLTVIDTFTDVTDNSSPPLNSNGLAVAFAWLWLLPIVISWLQFGPRCDRVSLHRALRHANRLAWVATTAGNPVAANAQSSRRAITLALRDGTRSTDEHRTPPVYNYARVFRWSAAVEDVYAGFKEASRRAEQHMPVEGTVWVMGELEAEIKAENRRGSVEQVASYIQGEAVHRPDRGTLIVGSDVIFRILASSFFALLLTWGTVSAAILLEWFTPTIGLSCRSGSYLMYASVSTIAWIFLVASSVLSFLPPPPPPYPRKPHGIARAQTASVLLRRAGKALAALNAIWLVLICLFQFSGVYDRCWCISSILHLGSRAYAVSILTPADIAAFWYPVVGATVLARCVIYLFFEA